MRVNQFIKRQKFQFVVYQYIPGTNETVMIKLYDSLSLAKKEFPKAVVHTSPLRRGYIKGKK